MDYAKRVFKLNMFIQIKMFVAANVQNAILIYAQYVWITLIIINHYINDQIVFLAKKKIVNIAWIIHYLIHLLTQYQLQIP